MSEDKKTYKPDQVLDHDYDGIQEYDNRLPNWWLWTLWGAIIFAVGYWLAFHTYGWAMNPVARYEASMEAAGPMADIASRGLSEEDLMALSGDPSVLEEGKAVYAQYCQVCHLPEGQGLVGPNLTDGHWIHGGRLTDIYDTVYNGVPEKGMLSWKNSLPLSDILAVSAYVGTLRGTSPAQPKAPQGDPFEYDLEAILAEEAATADTDAGADAEESDSAVTPDTTTES